MAQHQIQVIGSLNMDFITRTPRMPEPGETVIATSFQTGFGGKGANQCVACARLATDDILVRMVGKVGDDMFGRSYMEALKKEGIDEGSVFYSDKPTGVATILVDDSTGENRILVAPNANYDYSDGEIEAEGNGPWGSVEEGKNEIDIYQLEIPLQLVLKKMHASREGCVHVILNPAPAVLLPDFVYQDIDTLIMNETESAILAGPREHDKEHHHLPPEKLASMFLKWGVREAVIITLGSEGLVYATASGSSGHIPARKVTVVDTTAAGDTFVGAYAVQRARHMSGDFDFENALQFATLAASKSVERTGAMASIPRRNELD